MSASWLEELAELLKTPPSRLLAIGLDETVVERLGATSAVAVETWPQPVIDGAAGDRSKGDRSEGDTAGFDRVVWRADEAPSVVSAGTLALLCAERCRGYLVLPKRARRQAILNLSAAGLAVHDEAEGSGTANGEWVIIVFRPTDFVIRSYEPGDEDDILKMFKPSFHVERSAAHWRWKFEKQPFGSHAITVARSSDGELAAHYAGYPVPFERFESRNRSRSFVGLQIGDTMTLPKFRSIGRGPTSLLGRAARHFYAAYCEDNVAFNFGFNTGNIQRFSRRFVRAHLVEKVGYWVRPDGLPPESGRAYKIQKVRQLDPSWDRFYCRVGPAYGLLVRRDSRWLRWRYLECPDTPAFLVLAARRWRRLVGWSVFRRHGDTLRWCDALFDPKHVESAWPLLREALQAPEMDGVARVEAWFPPRPEWWRRELVALGFEPAAQPDDLAVMTVPFKEASDALLLDWYYTMGDGDLA